MSTLQRTRAKEVAEHVAGVVGALQREYLPQGARVRPTARAATDLAILRRGGADIARADSRTKAVTVGDLPPNLVGHGDDPANAAESAAHAAIALYAVHQQSQTVAMHRPSVSLGRAVGRLGRSLTTDGSLDEAVLRRFQGVELAATETGRLYHLRQLVQLLRSHDVAMDYGVFAADLYQMHFADGAPRVRLRWSRDLYRRSGSASTTDDATPAATTENGESR